jgi:short-subunit dehydrogenase
MERSTVPSSLWMTADFVVEESLRGFDRRELIVVPGWRYKLVVAGMKLIPKALLRNISIGAVRRYRRRKQA